MRVVLPEQTFADYVLGFKIFGFVMINFLGVNIMGVDFNLIGHKAFVVRLITVFGLHGSPLKYIY